MKKDTTSDCGFTLIELIISIAIISVLLITGVYMLSTTLTLIKNEGGDTELLYQAQDAMEKLTSGQISDLNEYPKLLLLVNDAETMIFKDDSDNSFNIIGKYYIIKEQNTSKIIIRSFVPN
ncbi:prepilin-type N-terminal cleavage/methylation domain-containing protein [Alkalibaculum sp. M08DMB]|uniref:Prepilin-type N-terminal cleavage/methylation domain-containing protein n=1 Tax=Alkalibaculum sporogenes TaxID=2655001 RepID=A0A6A7KEA8_9FIRM|nr:prepilin-type N-terminal cleavage/methylation domain-containing protein [Alkalibaculum sporogenes]MPW27313.1 prepilin-type N-terminal cleavage/methylation domain-containing protein [Alkalibaculum sporogenes]